MEVAPWCLRMEPVQQLHMWELPISALCPVQGGVEQARAGGDDRGVVTLLGATSASAGRPGTRRRVQAFCSSSAPRRRAVEAVSGSHEREPLDQIEASRLRLLTELAGPGSVELAGEHQCVAADKDGILRPNLPLSFCCNVAAQTALSSAGEDQQHAEREQWGWYVRPAALPSNASAGCRRSTANQHCSEHQILQTPRPMPPLSRLHPRERRW